MRQCNSSKKAESRKWYESSLNDNQQAEVKEGQERPDKYIDTEQLGKLSVEATRSGGWEGRLCAETAWGSRTFSCRRDRSSQ